MRILLSLLLALTVQAQDLDLNNYCPKDTMEVVYFTANGTCYTYGCTMRIWTSAHENCKSNKGSLLIFKDKSNEDAVIKQLIEGEMSERRFYWLDIKKYGDSWKWTTGAALTYPPKWETGIGECAVIDVDRQSWSPRVCHTEYWDVGCICQYGTSSSWRVTQGSCISLTLVLTVFRIFVTDR